MRLLVARGCNPTAQTLTQLLREQGANISQNAEAVVCWGAGTNTTPSLNAHCSDYNKLQQLEVLQRAGVPVPQFSRTPTEEMFPAFARKFRHVGGRDIRVCLQMEDANRHVGDDRYFTKFIPSTREFRVWIYRRRHLGTYQKVLRRPEVIRGFGRNYDNGYNFELVRSADVPRQAVDYAAQSVSALNLDFGAVDLLETSDGRHVILEVNTAPGVEGPRQCITALAEKIVRWERLGYPNRRGSGE